MTNLTIYLGWLKPLVHKAVSGVSNVTGEIYNLSMIEIIIDRLFQDKPSKHINK